MGQASAEGPMEARIARLESDVAHMCTDVADIKIDLRSLRDKINDVDKRLNAKIDDVADRFSGKFEAVDRRFETLQGSIASMKIWTLTLYIVFSGAMLGTMARGFGWI